MSYSDFLKSKSQSIKTKGFDVDDSMLNPNLFDFQRAIVKQALSAGKFAIFADCGLGKTIMQLEWAHQVFRHTQKPVLVLTPLAVSLQTVAEAHKFGLECVSRFSGDYDGVVVSNYEQLPNIDASKFGGVVLDESSILKNFQGKTKQMIVDAFADTHFKLACTATPSPNDPMEIGNHAEFLDVMTRTQMLAMYFVHDGGQTAKWRLKRHASDSFYSFIRTFAVMLTNPSDLGFDGSNYVLPHLEMIEEQVKTGHRDNGLLFNDVAISATDFNKELRETKTARLDRVISIIKSKPCEPFLVWVKHNDEGAYIKNQIQDAVEVKGSDSVSHKENTLTGFAKGEFRVLITKTKIAQFGMNFQNCNNQIFASLDFSFESLYQAIRRSYRFGQKKQVNIYLITTDTMTNVKASIDLKHKQFKDMQQGMNKAMNATQSISHTSCGDAVIDDEYTIKRGDCVSLIKDVESESIGISVFSPPFADLYTYSSHIEDMGNSKDYNEFMMQFSFLVSELYRVMKSGRNVCVHCMDLPIQKGKEGFIGLRDFSGMLINAFSDAGFIYHSRITIWKDPVVEMQRTKALGLLHKQVKKDSTMSRVGIPDYVLIFRKDGDRNDPVKNEGISVDYWQKIASPVWMDINYSNTLQGYRNARDEKDEKHICPLQLDTIERLITLYSNEGDTMLTPFMGIGSEAYQAVKMNRKAIGFELKESYFEQAKLNMAAVIESKRQTALF